MISKRCKTHNLLNHIKQKNIDHNLNFEFCNEKGSKNYLLWIATFTLNDREFVGTGSSQQKAITNFMEEAEDYVYSLIKVKN